MTTRYYGPKDRSKLHKVGVYGVTFEVVVAHDLLRAQDNKARVKRLGKREDDEHVSGLCIRNGKHFAVMFDRGDLNHDVIAHEVFHATGHIMHRCNAEFDPLNSEPYSFLAGYLTSLVYGDIKRWEIKITNG